MVLWFVTFLLFFVGLRLVLPDLIRLMRPIIAMIGSVDLGGQKKDLERVSIFLREIEETLLAGLVPSEERWRKISNLPSPWRKLTDDSLRELRESGASLIPTLKRLRALAEDQIASLADAQSRSAQAMAQAMICSILVPILGSAIYILLPEVSENLRLWLISCSLAILLALIGALWLLQMTAGARWGGLPKSRRSWILASLCAGERFLALVRSGTTPDLAWVKACELAKLDSEELAYAWGASIWESMPIKCRTPLEQVIIATGSSIKKSVQISLMEGTPCTERVEAVLLALRKDMNAQVQRELALLATRALKPLFICVAPALFSLLGGGLWITAHKMLSTF